MNAGTRATLVHRPVPAQVAILAGMALLLAAGKAPVSAIGPVDVRAEFSKFDPQHRTHLNDLRGQVRGLEHTVQGLEASGRPTRCAQQALTELRWRVNNTADYAASKAEIARLAQLVADPEAAGASDGQDPADGAWGRCYTEWFFRLDASYDAMSELDGKPPAVPPRFLDRVNDPERLQAYFDGLAVSDIARDGINRRRELNESLADLMRLILRERPAGYVWKPGVKQRLLELINGSLRNPATGFWGAAYRIDGAIVHVPDLSITFHVVKYLDGDITDWPKLLDRLIAIRDLRYPQGWRQENGYLNHDLYDVVSLFRLGWSHADDEQRGIIREQAGRVLDWSLTHTFRPDGSVILDPNDDSTETAYYFAVSLLDELGYFDKAKRFWTDRDFPEAATLAEKLRRHVEAALAVGASGEGGTYYRGALKRLDSAPR